MMLSGAEIARAVAEGTVVLSPFDQDRVRPSSYTLTLAPRLLLLDDAAAEASTVEHDDSGQFMDVPPDGDGLTLRPGRFHLAASAELVRLPAQIAGVLSAASRLARLGVLMNGGAQLVQAGFGLEEPTAITFEIFNATARCVRLQVGMPFCHLVLFRHDPATLPPIQRDRGEGPHPARFRHDA